MPWDLDPPRSLESERSQPLWWFHEAEVKKEIGILPWLRPPTAFGYQKLCSICRYLDISRIFGPPYEKKDASVFAASIGGMDYVFGELRLGKLDDLKSKVENCPLCHCLHTLFATTYPDNWTWKDRQEWYNGATQGDQITGGRSLGEARDVWYGLVLPATKSRWSQMLQGPQATSHRQLSLHLHSNGGYEIVPGGYRCLQHFQHVSPGWTYLEVVDAGQPVEIAAGMKRVEPRINYEDVIKLLAECSHTHRGHDQEPCPAATPRALRRPHITNFVDVRNHCLVTSDVLDTAYATLSYVWGETRPLELSSEGWNALWKPDGLEAVYPKLHPAILDSIRVCRGLGIRYLWSDAVSIVQNSPDKMQQIRRMHLIYTNSKVTLVAGSGPNHGLSGVRNQTRQRSQISTQVSPDIMVGVRFEAPPEDYGIFAWDRRGWTLQEAMLSSHVLFFGQSDWRYDCPHGSTFEHEIRDVHDQPNAKCEHASERGSTIHSSNDADRWLYRNIVTEYSTRVLSVPSDVVNAFVGLMAAVAEHFRSKVFISCLPAASLDVALLWRRRGHSRLVRRSEPALPRWSWAGWQGAVMPFSEGKLIHCFKLVPHSRQLAAACANTLFTRDYAPLNISKTAWDGELSISRTPPRCPDGHRHQHNGICQHEQEFQNMMVSELHILTDVASFRVRWDQDPQTVWEKDAQEILDANDNYIGNICFDDFDSDQDMTSIVTIRFARIAYRRFVWNTKAPAAGIFKVGKRNVPVSDHVGWRQFWDDNPPGTQASMQDLAWQCSLYAALAIDEHDQRLGLAEILVDAFDKVSGKGALVQLK